MFIVLSYGYALRKGETRNRRASVLLGGQNIPQVSRCYTWKKHHFTNFGTVPPFSSVDSFHLFRSFKAVAKCNLCWFCPIPKHRPLVRLITTITISSNVTGTLASLFFTYHSVQLLLDSVIGEVAVIGHI